MDNTLIKPIRYTYCSKCNNWITAAAWASLTEKEQKSFTRSAAKDGLLIGEKPKKDWLDMDYGCKC